MGFPRFKNRAHAGKVLGFDSGLERINAEHIEKTLGLPLLYETLKIRYVVPESFHIYHPDFELPNGIIVETKGRFLSVDRAKQLLVKAQYPDLDIRYVFTRARTPIGPGAKMTVGQWADKHGYKWAEKLIPASWATEPGPKRKPRDVIAGGPVGGWDNDATTRPRAA